jgi:uncharacterized membrane protein YphA (DoxX/SURF4 family)
MPIYIGDVTGVEIIGAIARAIVGLALMSAGFFKLRAGAAWPRQAADMGVGRTVAMFVPWAELLIGSLTLLGAFRPWSVVAAALLLLAFTALIILRILDGSRPPCACFGTRSDRPLGGEHVARNVALLASAAVAIWVG